MLAPSATGVGVPDLVMATSEPLVTVTVALEVLLARLPSGMGEVSPLTAPVAKAAVMLPLMLATAGTVRTGAAAPEASGPLRRQLTVPVVSG